MLLLLLHFHPTMFEHFPLSRGSNVAALTPESFEACDIWIGDRQHPSSLLPLCQPCARQLIKGGPIYAHFCALCGISFLFRLFFNRQKHSENTPLFFVIPNSAADIAAKRQRWARKLLFELARLNHSWFDF